MSEQAKQSKLNFWSDNLPKVYFILQILFGIALCFWVLINHQPKTGDDVEHLHSAWLVFQGEIPYRDFFQHHNPLLWYLFAPLVGFFAYDLAIYDIVRVISTLLMFVTVLISAKITSKFISQSKYAGLLTIASVFPSYILLSGQDFRPDNYMVFCFMAGLYFFFDYLEVKRLNKLVVSFVFMWLTFMFMQKSIFFLGLFGLAVLYLLYKKQIKWQDFAKALVIPVLGMLVFISWLAYYGLFEKYWLCNFIFNLYIPDVYNNLAEPTHVEFYILSFIAFIGVIYYLWRGSVAAKIISILWISEAIQRFFYFSLDRHYYYFLDILNAVLAGGITWEAIKRWKWSAYGFVILSIAACWQFVKYCEENKLSPDYFRYVTPKYVLEQTNRCDAVLNGYGLTYGIFSKDLTYYWNLNGQLDVIGNKIGLAPLPDLNDVVEKHFPQVIYTGPFWDEKLRHQNISYPVHWIDATMRDKYYYQSLFVDIFLLKPEYQQNRRCRYDAATKTWKYYYKE